MAVPALPSVFHVLCPRQSVRHTLFNSYYNASKAPEAKQQVTGNDTGQSNRQCRIKKRGKGHRLPLQVKYIVEGVRTFFNN